jgi:hypothetical protein
MPYRSLVEAGAAVGRTRSAILKAIKRGAISATRDPATGGWLIEPAELHRVFPAVSPDVSQGTLVDSKDTRETADSGEMRELRARLGDKDAVIDDLRRRLDIATAQLGEALQQVRVLTDQRTPPPAAPASAPRRSWWPWRR